MYVVIAVPIVCTIVRRVKLIPRLYFVLAGFLVISFFFGLFGYFALFSVYDYENYYILSRGLDVMYILACILSFYSKHAVLTNIIIVESMVTVACAAFMWFFRYWIYKPLKPVLFIAALAIGLAYAITLPGMYFAQPFAYILTVKLPYTDYPLPYVIMAQQIVCLPVMVAPVLLGMSPIIYCCYFGIKMELRAPKKNPLPLNDDPLVCALENFIPVLFNRYIDHCQRREAMGLRFQDWYVGIFRNRHNTYKRVAAFIYSKRIIILTTLYVLLLIAAIAACLFVFL